MTDIACNQNRNVKKSATRSRPSRATKQKNSAAKRPNEVRKTVLPPVQNSRKCVHQTETRAETIKTACTKESQVGPFKAELRDCKATHVFDEKYVLPKTGGTLDKFMEQMRIVEQIQENESNGVKNSIELNIDKLRKEAALMSKRNREIWLKRDESKRKKEPRVPKRLPGVDKWDNKNPVTLDRVAQDKLRIWR